MNHKKRIREKKHLRKAMRGRGACALCAPMLLHPLPAVAVQPARLACPKCGREIALDAGSEAAVDRLFECLLATGDFCERGMRRVVNGEVVREGSCECEKQHFELIGNSSANNEATHGY